MTFSSIEPPYGLLVLSRRRASLLAFLWDVLKATGIVVQLIINNVFNNSVFIIWTCLYLFCLLCCCGPLTCGMKVGVTAVCMVDCSIEYAVENCHHKFNIQRVLVRFRDFRFS